MNREFKFIGELPIGYEYKICKIGDSLRVIGVHPHKKPIGFTIESDVKLVPIELEPRFMPDDTRA